MSGRSAIDGQGSPRAFTATGFRAELANQLCITSSSSSSASSRIPRRSTMNKDCGEVMEKRIEIVERDDAGNVTATYIQTPAGQNNKNNRVDVVVSVVQR